MSYVTVNVLSGKTEAIPCIPNKEKQVQKSSFQSLNCGSRERIFKSKCGTEDQEILGDIVHLFDFSAFIYTLFIFM